MNADSPGDVLLVWTGLAVASVALLGVAVGLPTGAPDATDPARTVDDVAASPYDATASAEFATRSRLVLDTNGLERCRDGACSRARFAFGPVIPVADGSSLAAVLDGRPPEELFDSPAALRRAVADARDRAPVTRRSATRLHARHVTWGGVDVTLVGA